MCKDYDDISSKHVTDIGITGLVQLSLQPKGNIKPLNQKKHIHCPKTQGKAMTRANRFEKNRNNFPSTSNFASPVFIVSKIKDPNTYEITHRMVVNFRKMNDQLECWSYPLMCIDRIFSKLNGSKLFSTLDARSGYYNITIAEDGRQYAAFTTEYGKYEFLSVLFGIHAAPS